MTNNQIQMTSNKTSRTKQQIGIQLHPLLYKHYLKGKETNINNQGKYMT